MDRSSDIVKKKKEKRKRYGASEKKRGGHPPVSTAEPTPASSDLSSILFLSFFFFHLPSSPPRASPAVSSCTLEKTERFERIRRMTCDFRRSPTVFQRIFRIDPRRDPSGEDRSIHRGKVSERVGRDSTRLPDQAEATN